MTQHVYAETVLAGLCFHLSFQRKNPGASVPDVGKAAGEAWSVMSEGEKLVYKKANEKEQRELNLEKSKSAL